MTFKTLLAAAAATTLMAGAAQAQNMSQPADSTSAQTGVPSVDMTRPTGGEAGKTMLPNGVVGPANGSTAGPDTMGSSSTGMSSSSASTGSSADTSTTTSADAGSGASLTTSTVSNGPVADTPENRAKYRPLSRAGNRTAAKGN
jgi:hypothetical protein